MHYLCGKLCSQGWTIILGFLEAPKTDNQTLTFVTLVWTGMEQPSQREGRREVLLGQLPMLFPPGRLPEGGGGQKDRTRGRREPQYHRLLCSPYAGKATESSLGGHTTSQTSLPKRRNIVPGSNLGHVLYVEKSRMEVTRRHRTRLHACRGQPSPERWGERPELGFWESLCDGLLREGKAGVEWLVLRQQPSIQKSTWRRATRPLCRRLEGSPGWERAAPEPPAVTPG